MASSDSATAGKPRVMVDFLDRYEADAPLFVREVLAVEPEVYQDEVMRHYDARARRISMRSGHGVGKTAVLAWIIIHHALTRFPQKTVITAPTAAQLWDALWNEVKMWIGKLPDPLRELWTLKAERIELSRAPEESFISARTSRAENPEALQGVHAENVLLIADEASGIPEQVFEAAAGSMSGHNAITILAGNPVRGQGFFYDTHHKLADMWKLLHVSCLNSRLVTPDYIEDIKRRYGEESNAYRIRVLGEFPISDDDTVIPFDLVEAATGRDVLPTKTAPMIWGVDCARFGNDRSTLAKRRGNMLAERVRAWAKLDTMQLAGRIKHEYDETPLNDRPIEINVDSIGIGAGVVDRLRQLGLPVRGINVSESPALNGDKYRNLRAELWFKARAWFAKRECRVVKDEDLIEELTTPRYKFSNANGKIQIEAKDEMKKRGMKSPDLADAFILTFASDAGAMIHGSSYGRSSWTRPLSTPIKGIV